jgi:Ca2+-binding EF-hand superfamily protein
MTPADWRAVLAGVLLGVALPAGPTEPLRPQDRLDAFGKLDTDKDGFLSRREVAAHPEVAANFDDADRNQDGRLGPEEFETVPLNRSDQPGVFQGPERG